MTIVTLDIEFLTFISQFETTGDRYTHVSPYLSNKRYFIPPERLAELFGQIHDCLQRDGDYSLAEHRSGTRPLVVQCRMHYREQVDSSFSDRFLVNLINIIQGIIIKYCDHKDNSSIFICFITEPDDSVLVYEKTEDSMGRESYMYSLDIHFPYCVLSQENLRFIRDEMYKGLQDVDILGFLDYQCSEQLTRCIDICLGDLVMNQSIKNKRGIKMTLTKSSGLLAREDVQSERLNEQDLEEVIDYEVNSIPGIALNDEDSTDSSWLPLFFSLGFYGHIVEFKGDEISNDRRSVIANVDEYENYRILLNLLSPSRAIEEHYWVNIGKGLFSLSKGSDWGLQLWGEFSINKFQQANSEFDRDCGKIWSDMSESGMSNITVKTIEYYLYQENRSAYEQWVKTKVEQAIRTASNNLHTSVANAFALCYPFHFVHCAKSWWFFQGHRWIKDKDTTHIRRQMVGDFMNRITAVMNELNRRRSDLGLNQDDNETNRLNREFTGLKKLQENLMKSPFKKTIMEELMLNYSFPNFDTIRDNNQYVLVHSSGVTEIFVQGTGKDRTKKIVFRPGKPEDYCTISTGLNYNPEKRPKQEFIDKLERYFRQMYTDDSQREWMLAYFSSLVEGGNKDKQFVMLRGMGDNSKSALIKLIQKTFGDYMKKGDPTMISVGKYESEGNATPQLSRLQGCRLLVIDEVDSRAFLDAGKIRRLTGGDNRYARDLYEGGGDIRELKQMFKIVATLNKRAPINDPNVPALWNRIKESVFRSTFVDKAPPLEEDQWRLMIFPRDPDFEENLDILAPTFMWMLLTKYYPNYAKSGMPKCKLIETWTLEYRKNADLITSYFDERLKKSPGNRVDVKIVFSDFREWMKFNFPDNKKFDKSKLITELAEKNIVVKKGHFEDIELVGRDLHRKSEEELRETQYREGTLRRPMTPRMSGTSTRLTPVDLSTIAQSTRPHYDMSYRTEEGSRSNSPVEESEDVPTETYEEFD